MIYMKITKSKVIQFKEKEKKKTGSKNRGRSGRKKKR